MEKLAATRLTKLETRTAIHSSDWIRVALYTRPCLPKIPRNDKPCTRLKNKTHFSDRASRDLYSSGGKGTTIDSVSQGMSMNMRKKGGICGELRQKINADGRICWSYITTLSDQLSVSTVPSQRSSTCDIARPIKVFPKLIYQCYSYCQLTLEITCRWLSFPITSNQVF